MTVVVTFLITLITIVSGIITIVWFIRDVRKENSKILKAILESEQNQTTALEKISEMLLNQTKILERIASR
ncbi:MAG: hypothetical protein QME68_04640 [Elusimicrobiota bacterium]|nr:hypothetical protein [Elusimicrobiota bacterium]